jgi:cholesterol 24(S)-hydroxylase
MEAISILGNEPEDVLPTIEQTKKMKYINQIMKEVQLYFIDSYYFI